MTDKRYSDFFKRMPVGQYSGSERQDPRPLVEPDSDTEFTRDMALDDLPNDPDFQAEVKTQMAEKFKVIEMASGVDPKILRIHAVGQSHIDMAWRWRYEQCHQKAIITFRKAVYHARRFPSTYRFALSEPQLLDWLREDDPSLFKDIQDEVNKGTIELIGGSWVEPDCMMPCGEAMCRTRLYGQRFYREYFGKVARVEWFLDSFGYNWGLPQLITKSGGFFFYTSKITWNRQTVFPFVNFLWEGPDGTRLLTANFNMGLGPIEQWVKFEPGHRPVKKGEQYLADYTRDYYDLEDHVAQDEIVPVVGYFHGKGDGGHGPTHLEVATMNEQARLGLIQWSSVRSFFEDLAKWKDRLPIWRDELYLEYHRGTFSVHAEVKRHNRLYENALISADALATVLAASNPQYGKPAALLEDMWKILLLNQFHDVLPGSSIPEVYDDVADDWLALDSGLSWIYDECAKALPAPPEADLFLYNPTPAKRKGPVFIPVEALPRLTRDPHVTKADLELVSLGAEAGEYLAQPAHPEPKWWPYRRGEGWWVVVELEPWSITPFKVVVNPEGPWEPIDAAADDRPFLDNGVIRVELDPKTGAITKLTSNRVPGVNNCVEGTQSNLHVAYLDDYPHDHAWNLKPEYWKYPIPMRNDEDVSVRLAAHHTTYATLEIQRTLGEAKSKVTQRVTLFAGCPEVYLEWFADWQEKYRLLKIQYDTTTKAEKCTADAAYCAIIRSTNPQVPADKARYEKIMHKYADVSAPDNSWGVALLNEGRYAFDATGGQIRLTMLRTPVYPTPAPEAWVVHERSARAAAGKGGVPEFSGLGPFRCRYALLPHAGGVLVTQDGKPNPEVKDRADAYNAPVVVLPASPPPASNPQAAGNFVDGRPIAAASPANVAVTAVKHNEWDRTHNLVLRIVEVCGQDVAGQAIVALHPLLAKKVKGARAVDILETPLPAVPVKWDANTGRLTLPLKHFEVATVELLL